MTAGIELANQVTFIYSYYLVTTEIVLHKRMFSISAVFFSPESLKVVVETKSAKGKDVKHLMGVY